MGEWAMTALLCLGFGLAVWGMYRLACWADSRLTPEQRKEAERFEWRHRR